MVKPLTDPHMADHKSLKEILHTLSDKLSQKIYDEYSKKQNDNKNPSKLNCQCALCLEESKTLNTFVLSRKYAKNAYNHTQANVSLQKDITLNIRLKHSE